MDTGGSETALARTAAVCVPLFHKIESRIEAQVARTRGVPKALERLGAKKMDQSNAGPAEQAAKLAKQTFATKDYPKPMQDA